jgi:hypothetical protein
MPKPWLTEDKGAGEPLPYAGQLGLTHEDWLYQSKWYKIKRVLLSE